MEIEDPVVMKLAHRVAEICFGFYKALEYEEMQQSQEPAREEYVLHQSGSITFWNGGADPCVCRFLDLPRCTCGDNGSFSAATACI